MKNSIRFSGNADYGYSASRGGTSVNVRRDGAFWVASYGGIPMLHNPIKPTADGRVTISCSCPTIVVGNGFTKRNDAAQAALDVKNKEENNWRLAQDQVREANPDALGSVNLKRARALYAELVA
jgi:hypothetical protein